MQMILQQGEFTKESEERCEAFQKHFAQPFRAKGKTLLYEGPATSSSGYRASWGEIRSVAKIDHA